MLGDGSYRNGRPVKYSSTSKKLSDDAQEILLKIGLAGTQYLDSSNRFGNPVWHLSISSMKALTPHVNSEVDSRKWVDYDGEVFCVEVPNHIIYVRREGKVCWCGNCVWKQGTNQYAFDCKIVVGDGSTATYFTDLDKQITWNEGSLSANYQFFLEVKANAYATFGKLVDASTKKVSQSVQIFIAETSHNGRIGAFIVGAYTYFYGCAVYAGTLSHSLVATVVYHTLLSRNVHIESINNNGSIFDLIHVSDGYGTGIRPSAVGVIVDKVSVIGCYAAIDYSGIGTVSISNVYVRGSTGYFMRLYADSSTTTVNLINVDSDLWTFYRNLGASSQAKFFVSTSLTSQSLIRIIIRFQAPL